MTDPARSQPRAQLVARDGARRHCSGGVAVNVAADHNQAIVIVMGSDDDGSPRLRVTIALARAPSDRLEGSQVEAAGNRPDLR